MNNIIKVNIVASNMASGRKERILISCVSFEVSKIVEPAIYYEATRIHLIHYGKEPVYQEFYDEVEKRLKEELPKSKIIEHGEDPIFNFEKMMNLILRIIRQEQKDSNGAADIYVNISAGPSEYSAASLIASMMMKGVMPFNVSTDKYQVPLDRVKDVYYDNGHPVGMTKVPKEPNLFSTYEIQKPDEKLVLGLGILDEQIRKKASSAPVMIPLLKENGLMDYTKADSGKPDQKSTMNYQRNFVDRWLDKGWVEKVSKREMKITDEGRTILDVFLSCYKQ